MNGAAPLLTVAVTGSASARIHGLIEAMIEVTASERERVGGRALAVTVSREPRTDVVTIRTPTRTLELTRAHADVTIPEFLADVVVAVFGPDDEPRAALACLARASAFAEPPVLVYLDGSATLEPAALDQRELELRELLELVGLDGGALFIRGESERARRGDVRWRRPVQALLGALTHDITTPTRALLEPARGRVQYSWPAGSEDPRPLTEHTILYAPRWITLVTGIERGTMRVGDTLELITPYNVTRVELERIRHARVSGRADARAGQTAELTVRTERDVLRVLIGSLLRTPDERDALRAAQRYRVELAEFSRPRAAVDSSWLAAGERAPLRIGLGPAIWVAAEAARDGEGAPDEGEHVAATLRFHRPVVLPPDARFFFSGPRGLLGRGRCREPVLTAPDWTLEDQLEAMRLASPLMLD
ncbi:MAG: hypothetical protein H6713_27420 [Myxococcales bacterium]|nr:hypothetical protein [Myxococcales bacterium]